MWLNYSVFPGPLEKKAFSLGWCSEWRSEPHFWVLIPSPSPDVWELQRERENRRLRGTDRKERSHPGWHWILLENFGYALLCWSVAMPAEMVFFVAQDSMKGQVWHSLRRRTLAVFRGMHRRQIPLEWVSKHQESLLVGSLGCIYSKVHDLACMGISEVCECCTWKGQPMYTHFTVQYFWLPTEPSTVTNIFPWLYVGYG